MRNHWQGRVMRISTVRGYSTTGLRLRLINSQPLAQQPTSPPLSALYTTSIRNRTFCRRIWVCRVSKEVLQCYLRFRWSWGSGRRAGLLGGLGGGGVERSSSASYSSQVSWSDSESAVACKQFLCSTIEIGDIDYSCTWRVDLRGFSELRKTQVEKESKNET